MRAWMTLVLALGACSADPALPDPPPTDAPAATGDTAPPAPVCTADTPVEACTTSGKVVGQAVGAHRRWLGIPFAAPPVGPLRWQPPAPIAWDEPRTTQAFGPRCPQFEGNPPVQIGDEDCLTLNVYAPADADGAPVLFWVHGGGHQQGGAANPIGTTGEILADGTTFAERFDVVVVSINYRLGPFGFLAHPALRAEGEGSGNYGMLDQIAALSWTRDNIAAFGGDPDRIVAFGESAGGVSVCRLLVTPRTDGMLAGAIMQSGGCVATTQERAESLGVDIAAAVECTDGDVPACLRSQTTASLMASFDPAIDISALGRATFDGVIDGTLVPDLPRSVIEAGNAHDVPVIIGANAQETGNTVGPIPTPEDYETAVRAWAAAAGLPAGIADQVLLAYPVDDYPSPRQAYIALTSDAKFVCGSRRNADALAEAHESPVYRYFFSQVPENGGALSAVYGAFHGLELFYLFDQIDAVYEPGPADVATTDAMAAAWSSLAAGTPLGDGWVPWTSGGTLTLIEDGVTVGADPRQAACDFWASLGGG